MGFLTSIWILALVVAVGAGGSLYMVALTLAPPAKGFGFVQAILKHHPVEIIVLAVSAFSFLSLTSLVVYHAILIGE